MVTLFVAYKKSYLYLQRLHARQNRWISLFEGYHINHFQDARRRYLETHIITTIGQSVETFRVIVILWAWVQFKHLAKNRKVLITETCAQLSRETHLNLLPTFFINKAAAHTGVCIGILNVRLNIIDWSTVNKVGTCNNKRKPITPILYTQQAHR